MLEIYHDELQTSPSLVNAVPYSKHRAVASTKRIAGLEVNDARLEISYKRACDRLLEIPALRQSGEVLFCLDFSCFVLCIKAKNEVGFGAKPQDETRTEYKAFQADFFCHFLLSQKVTKEDLRPERTPSRASTSFERQAVRYGICYFAPQTLW